MKALYVTDRAAVGEPRWHGILEALAGAPDLSVQLREKQAPDRETLGRARQCRQALGRGVILYVNARFDIAVASGADGVHLPADGLPVASVRAATPRGLRIGVSAHSAAEAAAAIEAGADLVVLGPIFDTPAKRGFGPPLGPESLAQLPLSASHRAEVYAIGGVAEENLEQIDPFRDRIAGVAGIRLFQDSADPRGTVERLSRR